MTLRKLASLFIGLGLCAVHSSAQGPRPGLVTGTLVVAVPVNEGLVVCSDKRLFNHSTETFADDAVKIRQAGDNALFVATNTIGFRDNRTGEMGFDAFEITEKYLAKHPFTNTRPFWDGLREEIRKKLFDYFAGQRAADLPSTDFESGRLLFNLVFYSVVQKRIKSHTIRVFYERAATPIVSVPGVISEEVRTPKLSGKGRVVIAHISRTPTLSSDAAILRFDQYRFDMRKTSITDAVGFAEKLFYITNAALPGAYVSKTYDCALLGHQGGFRWLKPLS
ncbi:MAG TPA: hypothetical protein VJL58_07640 [Pyrinomonadaceae bacterium]|nr:hypothetical protein [Pyrinomonadaceae bacterium]